MLLKGNKVFLRPFEIEDAIFIRELRSDIEGQKKFLGNPFPSNLESEKEWISRMYPKGLRKDIYFAVVENNNGIFSGYCVARNINYIHRNAEVGIFLHINARGKGYFKDVMFIFCDYLFNQINLHKLYTFILIENSLSYESFKKIGFEMEGQVREQFYLDGKYKDAYFLSLYREKFYERRKEYFAKMQK